ncbi:MAG: hypothetical protein ABI847_12265 [Anaerolineales bacterium]
MVEILHIARAIVATQAIRAVLLYMLLHKGGVMACVAILASLDRCLEIELGRLAVTGRAAHIVAVVVFRVAAQRESGIGMPEGRVGRELDRAPACHRMAGAAILSGKHPGMRGRLGMAAGALGRGRFGRGFGLVAGRTLQAAMLSQKRKPRLGVVKASGAVDAIMAVLAIRPEGQHVRRDERPVMAGMAVNTHEWCECAVGAWVASLAGYRRVVIADNVAHQGETQSGVIERFHRICIWVKAPSLVVAMAGAAVARLLRLKPAMQAGAAGALLAHRCVARLAAGRRDAHQRRVTLIAVVFKFGMRGKTVQLYSCLGMRGQLPRAEHCSSGNPYGHPQPGSQDQRCQAAEGRKERMLALQCKRPARK